MSKILINYLLMGLLGVSTQVLALTLKDNAPRQYVVVKGDTLWGIAEKFTDNPWHWPEIWAHNQQIENPHLIFPGDTLGLVDIGGGQYRVLVVSRGEHSRLVKLQPTARIESLDALAIPTIPQDAIRGFLRHHKITEERIPETAPRVVAGKSGRVMMGAGDTIYGRGDFGDVIALSYGVYRRNVKPYIDPKTDEVLGYEALEIGQADVAAQHNDILTLELTHSNAQVSVGDLLMATEDRQIISHYHPKLPKEPVSGTILAVQRGVNQIGQYDVVVLDRGQRDGLEEGSVLVVNKRGETVYDRVNHEKIELPEERAGTLLVFRAYEKLAYGLIMRASQPMRIGDSVESPDL